MPNRMPSLTLILLLGFVSSPPLQAADAQQLFDFYCLQCHGPEGKGDGPNVNEHFATDPRNFTETAKMEKLSDADIRTVIADGGPAVSKSELMPPWGKTLSDEEIEALLGHLRKLCACEGPQ
jgi:cytochrome c oxidase cbb3-type subunit III